MQRIKTAYLLIVAIIILAIVAGDTRVHETTALCDGRPYALATAPHGASPYVRLSADGVSGQFLLDYGATASSLSASAFAPSNGSLAIADLSLAGFKGGSFVLRRYGMPLQPPGGQLGIIGTDVLSLLTLQFSEHMVFVGAQSCQPERMRARHFVPIAQSGFFSSNPSTDGEYPNVPVVFLRLGEVRTFAQIDTGYDDVLYNHSVDINETLFESLVKSGLVLDHLADLSVSTCEGHERRPVYTLKGSSLVIESDQGTPIARTTTFHLILKRANGCGGIAAMAVPAAQLGASFLKSFGTVIFDPKSETIWFEGDATEQKLASPAETTP